MYATMLCSAPLCSTNVWNPLNEISQVPSQTQLYSSALAFLFNWIITRCLAKPTVNSQPRLDVPAWWPAHIHHEWIINLHTPLCTEHFLYGCCLFRLRIQLGSRLSAAGVKNNPAAFHNKARRLLGLLTSALAHPTSVHFHLIIWSKGRRNGGGGDASHV